MPSRLICLTPGRLTAQFMETWLRSYNPPVISRVDKDRLLLDIRTIQDRELKPVAQAIRDLAGVERA